MPSIFPEGLSSLRTRCINHTAPEAAATVIRCGLLKKNFARVSYYFGNEKAVLENTESPEPKGLAEENEQSKSERRT
jgi:hypothetical protein